MESREVAVVGLATMGAGIAEVFARAGLRVVTIEADPAALSPGMSILERSLTRVVSHGKLTGQEQAGPATVLAGLQATGRASGDPALAPPPLLAEHAAAGLSFRR